MTKVVLLMTPISLLLVLIIIAAFPVEARVPMKKFHYVQENKNWTDARQHCREKFTDLASGSTLKEYLVNHFVTWKDGAKLVWIGLYRDLENASVWRWTGESGDASRDPNWHKGRIEMRSCTMINRTMFQNERCSGRRPYYCSNNDDRVAHFSTALSWFDAQESCKNNSAFLATVTADNYHEFEEWSGWIGLHVPPNTSRTSDDIWKWAGKDSDYRKWAPNRPLFEHCGCLRIQNKKWFRCHCSPLRTFICVTDNVVLVKENKTWEEALEHCRAIGSPDSSRHNHYGEHQYDLVSLQSEDDHRYARDKIQEASTNEVWTALRFLAGQWLWVDGEPQQYQDLPLCPAWGWHCGTLPKDHSTQWKIRDCMERRNFLCIKST